MDRVKAILEELMTIDFVAGERGYNAQDRELWKERLWRELCELTGARHTCLLCGEKYRQGLDIHDCMTR